MSQGMAGEFGLAVDKEHPSRAEIFSQICVSSYFLCFALVAVLFAFSPLVRAVSGITAYDRVLDGLTLLLLAIRLLEARVKPLSWRHAPPFALAVGYILGTAAINSQQHPLFEFRLLLFDGKILVLLACLWAFSNRPLLNDRLRRRWSSMMLWAFVVGTALFVIFGEDGARLRLVEESNYMILAFSVVAVVYLDTHAAKPGGLRWLSVFLFLGIACLLAQSRTGFAIFAVICIGSLGLSRRFGWLGAILLVAVLVAVAAGDTVFQTVARGASSIDEIDRVAFLQEYLLWARTQTPLEVLFGSHVGTFLTERPEYMWYLAERQATELDIPFGLAPFNFHSAYLRLVADLGVVPAAALLWLIYSTMRRSMHILVVVAVLMAAVSMSIFYLSSTMPILVLAQLLRPLKMSQKAAGTS